MRISATAPALLYLPTSMWVAAPATLVHPCTSRGGKYKAAFQAAEIEIFFIQGWLSLPTYYNKYSLSSGLSDRSQGVLCAFASQRTKLVFLYDFAPLRQMILVKLQAWLFIEFVQLEFLTQRIAIDAEHFRSPALVAGGVIHDHFE